MFHFDHPSGGHCVTVSFNQARSFHAMCVRICKISQGNSGNSSGITCAVQHCVTNFFKLVQ